MYSQRSKPMAILYKKDNNEQVIIVQFYYPNWGEVNSIFCSFTYMLNFSMCIE